jgi:hypothetical protein
MAHPRRRDWTLRDLDRSKGYWLRFDEAARRWDLLVQDDDGEWQRVVTRD